MSLSELRKQIDGINAEIIVLLSRRMQVAKQIAKVKRDEALPVDDWEREKAQCEMLRELAKQHSLSPAVIEEMFTLFVNYSKLEMKLTIGSL